eukprot:m51a1_g9113 hypothetical protein (422) ;mRNA; f:118224-121014
MRRRDLWPASPPSELSPALLSAAGLPALCAAAAADPALSRRVSDVASALAARARPKDAAASASLRGAGNARYRSGDHAGACRAYTEARRGPTAIGKWIGIFTAPGYFPRVTQAMTWATGDEISLLLSNRAASLVSLRLANSYAVTEVPCDPEESLEQIRIAQAVYPYASLVNHSCCPNTVLHFRGRDIVIRSAVDVAEGQELFGCYGPHCGHMPRRQRQRALRSQYFFDCRCPACSSGESLDAYRCVREGCGGCIAESDEGFACASCGARVADEQMAVLVGRRRHCAQLYDLAASRRAARDLEGARSALAQCLALRKSLLSRDHIEVAQTHDAMARVCNEMGEAEEAARSCRASVEVLERRYPPGSVELGYEYHKLAGLLVLSGAPQSDVAQAAGRAAALLSLVDSPLVDELRSMASGGAQ